MRASQGVFDGEGLLGRCWLLGRLNEEGDGEQRGGESSDAAGGHRVIITDARYLIVNGR